MIQNLAIRLLRASERYTKTDMVYLASSGIWTNAHVLLMSASSFILAIAFANLLPAEVYGAYQYLLSFSAIIGALTLTGMNHAITQSVARGHEGEMRHAVALQLSWGCVPFLASLAGAGYFLFQGDQSAAIGMIAIGILVPLANAFNTYSAFLSGRKKFKLGFFANAIITSTYFGSMLVGILFIKDALALLIINLLVGAMAMFGLYIWTTRTYVPNTSRDPEAIPYGKHLSLMYAFSLIVRQADSILVFNVLGAAALAVYTIATAIPERLSGFFRFLFIAALPQFSNRTKKSIRDSMLPKALKVTIAGLVLTLIYVIAAPYLFAVFFPRYMESLAYSQLYALIMIAAAGNLSVSALLSQRLKGELYFFNIALPLLQIILLVALIFPFGMVGVLVARIIGTVCETLVSLMFLFWSPFKDRNTTA